MESVIKPNSGLVPISVVILTKNEEQNIGACLQELKHYFDDIVVLDSESTDSTVRIATDHGVRVYSHEFTGFGDQRNWAIDHIPHRYSWVLHLDADERPTQEFVAELQAIAGSLTSHAGYFVPNKTILGETWLRYSVEYPVYQVRLFHVGKLRFENHGHGQRELTSGTLGTMKSPYLHYAFSKGLVDWLSKHARYARLEAQESKRSRSSFLSDLRNVFSKDAVLRRRSLKKLSFRVPCRGWIRFAHIYVLRRGFLDGRAGWTYARMISIYESMIGLFIVSGDRSE